MWPESNIQNRQTSERKTRLKVLFFVCVWLNLYIKITILLKKSNIKCTLVSFPASPISSFHLSNKSGDQTYFFAFFNSFFSSNWKFMHCFNLMCPILGIVHSLFIHRATDFKMRNKKARGNSIHCNTRTRKCKQV